MITEIPASETSPVPESASDSKVGRSRASADHGAGRRAGEHLTMTRTATEAGPDLPAFAQRGMVMASLRHAGG